MREWQLKPSTTALSALMLLHAGALVLILMAAPESTAQLILGGGVGLSWIWSRRHPVFGFGRQAVRGIRYSDEDGWSVWTPRHEWQPAQLLPASQAHPLLSVLQFQTEQGRQRRAVIRGDLDAEAFRQLRVRVLDSAKAQTAS